jgi:hypothetical protein
MDEAKKPELRRMKSDEKLRSNSILPLSNTSSVFAKASPITQFLYFS